jgi:asparagine synthase (glutamine-hydrolysing)
MCGIAGFKTVSFGSPDRFQNITSSMIASLQHRGPDDEGTWVDAEAGVAFVHSRLSIVDLSPTGHQPMTSADGRFVMIYNGEVYNHNEIRPELEARGIRFRGHSDSEVMLEAFAAFGILPTVKRLIGMFAIGLWDRRERTLLLIRDRVGIKPLYWAKFGDLFLFGSELKALRAHPGWTARIDRSAVATFMRHNYVPAPQTIYEGVQKLEPGTILTLPWNGEPQFERFWDARSVARAGLADPMQGSDTELTDQLETLLKDAVKRRMVADVPVGAFLSGGIDSSTVVALMKAANAGPVRTYTIGSELAGYNEAAHSAAVAKHLGTEHTELMVTSKEAIDVIPRLPDMYDEPFADSSQIPTFLVSAMTRRHVTVALSGDGGDELFAGYNRYHLTAQIWRSFSMLPHPVRRALAGMITTVPADRWNKLLSFIPASIRQRQIGDKMHKFAAVLPCKAETELYRRLVTHWEPSDVVLNADEPKGVLWDAQIDKDFPDLLERMQYFDQVTYLPDDILTKVDRASMAVALEARVPLIDHRVVEFSWRLPHKAKIRGGTSKWLLRQVLYRHVPKELVERPKMGFSVPLGDWLRGPLRPWAENLLAEPRLRQAGFFDAVRVRQTWDAHLTGRRNHEYMLWNVLMFEAWRDRWA